MNKISLDDIRLFVAVVQAGSLSSASELTSIPISRLSRRLTRLEKSLGTQIINRGKKGVTLNDIGHHFFIKAQGMLQEAQLAVESVQNSLSKPSGLLRISVSKDIFQGFVQTHLIHYLQKNPDVNIEVNFNQQKINMIQDGIDLAIRVGSIDNENVVAKTWKTVHFGIFASPSYINKDNIPQTPNDLYQHPLISQSYNQRWLFQQNNQEITILPHARAVVDDFFTVESMIKAGLGIGLLPLFEQPWRGLTPILKKWNIPSLPISLIYYKNRGAIPLVRNFVDYLRETSP